VLFRSAYPDPTYRQWIAQEWAARLEKSKRENTQFEPLELAIQAKDGSTKLAIVGVVALEGSLAGEHLVVLIDITERRKAERQLEESRRLASLGALAGGIAHDFNNLLTPILAHVDVALAEISPTSPCFTTLSEIQMAANRATGLVRQILAVSRPGDESKTSVDLVPLVDEVVHLLRASLPSTISIRTCIESNAPAVRADPTRIYQVILNLATNARDAMEGSGGVLTISVCRAKDGRLELTVSDTGVGIEPELMDRVFEPYFTTKVSSGGTGLGLATVRSIVGSLGGTITLQSERGKGTTVNVFFRAIDEERSSSRMEQPSPQPSMLSSSGGQHILVVDDEPMVARAAARMLIKMGYRATTAKDPEKALAIFRADPSFAAVLTDYTMPSMTGTDLARELLEIRPVRILIATGNPGLLEETINRKAHIRRVISKPYGMAALGEALSALFSDEH